FALVDCTGHGVPGAFVSLATNSLLDKAFLKDASSPKNLLMALGREIDDLAITKKSVMRDGFDIGMVCINEAKKQLTYAGTHISLFILRKNNGNEIPGALKFGAGEYCLYELK